MPLIDETEYTKMASAKTLLDAMGANPRTRQRILSLMKEINPNLVIPEIDAALPVIAELNAVKKHLAERDAQEAQRRASDEVNKLINDGRAKLRKMGFSPEGVDAVEKLMQERGLADYEAAGALYDRENPSEGAPIATGYDTKFSGLFAPPEDNVWAKAVSLPKGRGQERALAVAQDGEVKKWFAENRGTYPRRR